MIVCLCKNVSETDIQQAVDDGLDTFTQLQNSLSIASKCGTCSCEAKAVLAQHIKNKRKQVILASKIIASQPIPAV